MAAHEIQVRLTVRRYLSPTLAAILLWLGIPGRWVFKVSVV